MFGILKLPQQTWATPFNVPLCIVISQGMNFLGEERSEGKEEEILK